MKKLVSLACLGISLAGLTQANAAIIDLSSNKVEKGEFNNIYIVGTWVFQLGKYVTGPADVTGAAIDYSNHNPGVPNAPIYYVDNGIVYQITSKGSSKWEEVGTLEDKFPGEQIDATGLNGGELREIDEENDTTIKGYTDKLGELTDYEGLSKVTYDSANNEFTLTVSKNDAALKSFAEYMTSKGITGDFAKLTKDAVKIEYSIKGDYTDTKTITLSNITPVDVAKEILMAMAKANGSTKTKAGDLTYLDVANASVKAKVHYNTNSVEQIVEYTLKFNNTLTEEEAKTKKEEMNNKILSDYQNQLASAVASYEALKSVTYNTTDKKLTFEVSNKGLKENLISFLKVTSNGASIEDIFKQFTLNATKAEYTIGGKTTTIIDFENPTSLASELLLAIAKNKNSELTKTAATLTYEDVANAEPVTATFTYKDVPGYTGDVTIQYVLEFKYDDTAYAKETQEEKINTFAKPYVEEINSKLANDADAPVSKVEFVDNTLTIHVKKATGMVATFLLIESQDGKNVVELFKEFAKDATNVSYQIGNVSKNITDFSDPIALAKELLVAMTNKENVKTLTYSEVLNKKVTATFTYNVNGKVVKIDYTLTFK